MTSAINSTHEHVNALMAADAENEIQKSAQLLELENLKNAEQNELKDAEDWMTGEIMSCHFADFSVFLSVLFFLFFLSTSIL